MNGSGLLISVFICLFPASAFSQVSPPSVTRISSTLGPVGQWVYVHGTNFVSGQTLVAVGGVSNIPTTVYSTDQLGFRVPSGASGTSKIKVVTPMGFALSTEDYTVGIPTDPPSILSFSPTLGPSGQWIYLNGNNFVWGQSIVRMGEAVVTNVTVYGPTSLGFTAPSGVSGAVPISIETPFGTAISSGVYTFGVPTGSPVVTSFREYVGHNWVYANGSNFVWGQTYLKFGESNVSAVVYSPEQLGFAPPVDWQKVNVVKITTPSGFVNIPLKGWFIHEVPTKKGKSIKCSDLQT